MVTGVSVESGNAPECPSTAPWRMLLGLVLVGRTSESVIDILRILARERGPVPMQTIAKQVRLSKTTTLQIIRELARAGIVEVVTLRKEHIGRKPHGVMLRRDWNEKINRIIDTMCDCAKKYIDMIASESAKEPSKVAEREEHADAAEAEQVVSKQ